MNAESRKKDRVKGHIRVGYGKEEPIIFDLSENISLKGVFLRTPYPLEVGTDLKIEISFRSKRNKENIQLRINGRVARIVTPNQMSSGSDKEPGMGVEFLELTEEHIKKLQKIMSAL